MRFPSIGPSNNNNNTLWLVRHLQELEFGKMSPAVQKVLPLIALPQTDFYLVSKGIVALYSRSLFRIR